MRILVRILLMLLPRKEIPRRPESMPPLHLTTMKTIPMLAFSAKELRRILKDTESSKSRTESEKADLEKRIQRRRR